MMMKIEMEMGMEMAEMGETIVMNKMIMSKQ